MPQNKTLLNIQNNKFKNVTLDARSRKLGVTDISDKIFKPIADLSKTIDYIVNDPDKSDSKKFKDIDVLVKGHSDLVSSVISEELTTAHHKLAGFIEKGKPQSSPEDPLVLQQLLSKGVQPLDLHNHPEISNTIASSQYGAYLFGEEVSEKAKSTSFEFNLGEEYSEYVHQKDLAELVENYAESIGEHLSELSEQAESGLFTC